jgi:hypothetical protein
MLADTDMNDFDGLYVDHPRLSQERYLAFERENPVDYRLLENQFKPSPHTQRELQFSRINNPPPSLVGPVYDSVCAYETGSLVMIPNKKALTKLLRATGFEDCLEIAPHRFSEERYLNRYRVGLFGIKRDPNGAFPQSVIAAQLG